MKTLGMESESRQDPSCSCAHLSSSPAVVKPFPLLPCVYVAPHAHIDKGEFTNHCEAMVGMRILSVVGVGAYNTNQQFLKSHLGMLIANYSG